MKNHLQMENIQFSSSFCFPPLCSTAFCFVLARHLFQLHHYLICMVPHCCHPRFVCSPRQLCTRVISLPVNEILGRPWPMAASASALCDVRSTGLILIIFSGQSPVDQNQDGVDECFQSQPGGKAVQSFLSYISSKFKPLAKRIQTKVHYNKIMKLNQFLFFFVFPAITMPPRELGSIDTVSHPTSNLRHMFSESLQMFLNHVLSTKSLFRIL